MALTECSECGKEISSSAKTCPHCGKRKSVSSGYWGWATIGLLVLFGLIAFSTCQDQDRFADVPTKVYPVVISMSPNALTISAKLGGGLPSELRVYVNGMPYGSTPVASVERFKTPGGPAVIPLREFVGSDGRRFNPLSEAVVQVWIGGGAYDFEKFTFAR